jgi:thiol-disulfide isomerase/thioredoxin
MRSVPRALAICLLALSGLLAGYVGYRSAHRPSVIAVTSAPTPSSARAAADLGAGAAGQPRAPALPGTLPDIRMPDLSGTEHSLQQFRGHPLLVNFWATWCDPCRREMPLLQQLWQQDRASGLDIVGIAVDSRSAVQQYLRHTPVDYPLLVGEDAALTAIGRFGMDEVLPFSVFADARGRIVAVKVGELHRAEANYIVAAVQRVTAGSETLPQARAAIARKLRELAIQRAKRDVQGS